MAETILPTIRGCNWRIEKIATDQPRASDPLSALFVIRASLMLFPSDAPALESPT
jgi:hypothetical protein